MSKQTNRPSQPPISPDLVTDKFSDNAGDNTVTRYEINQSIVSKATANEHSFRQAMMEGLKEISQPKK